MFIAVTLKSWRARRRDASRRACADRSRSGRYWSSPRRCRRRSGWVVRDQRDRGHDLARLAIAALRRVGLDPGPLHGVQLLLAQAFDGQDRLARRVADRRYAGSRRLPVDRTVQAPQGPAPQPNFVPVRPSLVTQRPQQGRLRLDINAIFRPLTTRRAMVPAPPIPPAAAGPRKPIEAPKCGGLWRRRSNRESGKYSSVCRSGASQVDA